MAYKHPDGYRELSKILVPAAWAPVIAIVFWNLALTASLGPIVSVTPYDAHDAIRSALDQTKVDYELQIAAAVGAFYLQLLGGLRFFISSGDDRKNNEGE